jgi:two-component system sensor histidine kinase HydH
MTDQSHDSPTHPMAITARAWANRMSDVWETGVMVINTRGRVDFANQRAQRLLGVEGADAADASLTALLDTARIELHRAKPGDDVPVHFTAPVGEQLIDLRVYAVEEDECTGYLILLDSVNRLAAIEAALRHAAQDRGFASLYRDIAHDLRSVLNTIGVNVTLLSRAADQVSAADVAGRSGAIVRRELARVDRLLALGLDRRPADHSPTTPCDLLALIDRLVELCQARAERQGVRLDVQRTSEPLVVRGHQDRLQGALLNLFVNALEAMPDGGALDVTAGADADLAIVRIRDTGPGLPAEIVQSLWRAHRTTKPDGTGVGLHVTHATITAHGGRIGYARAGEAGGATFIIELPRVVDAPA